jgi:drug/metabolite transporter (DMT)-like permease
MPAGVLFALAAYLLYSCCDAIIKGFGNSLSVFEIAFWCALFSFLPAIFTKPKGERWRDALKLKHPVLLHLRSVIGTVGNLAIIYAFVSIPLAEAYSIAFLSPIFVVALSVLLLKEHVTWHRWVFLAASFLGVLLVVRPGFRELHLGHLTAVISAMFGAVAVIIVRKVAPIERRVSLIGLPLGYIVVINALLMIPYFRMPTPEQFAMLLIIGGMGGTANILFIAATRRAQASEIAPTQYSQIAWALFFGAMFYGEYPDLVAYVGLAIVVVSGILNVLSAETRIRIFSRMMGGIGPATAAAEREPPLPDDAPAPRAVPPANGLHLNKN